MIKIPAPNLIELFKTTKGAISLHEFFAISWLAEQSPAGVCIDLGTNAGKAAIAEAIGHSRKSAPVEMHCIDTVFDLKNDEAWKDNHMQPDRNTTGWSWIHEPNFLRDVKKRIELAGGGNVTAKLIGESVMTAAPRIGGPGVAFAFSDADSANKWLVDGIADALAPNMLKGGIIGWHDWDSQFIPPKQASDRLIASGEFEPVAIPWDEIKEAVDSIGGEHHGNDSWHHRETERPMFVGAVRRK